MSARPTAGAHIDPRDAAARPSLPWLVVLVVMIGMIWGNSLVPGEESGQMSLQVLEALRAGLAAVGLPNEWVTHHLVRKAAHFSEYLVLGVVGMQALRPHLLARCGARGARLAGRVAALASVLVAVPVVDEMVIQLLISVGRGGAFTDVLIDIAGATTGVLLTLLASRLLAALRR